MTVERASTASMVPLEGFAGRTAIALQECGARQAGQHSCEASQACKRRGRGGWKSLPLLRAPTRRPVGMFGDSLVFINNTAVARERVCVCTAAQPVHLPKKGRFTVGRRCPSEAAFHLSKSARKKSQRIIDLSAGRAWRFSAPPLQRGAPAFAARVASRRAAGSAAG